MHSRPNVQAIFHPLDANRQRAPRASENGRWRTPIPADDPASRCPPAAKLSKNGVKAAKDRGVHGFPNGIARIVPVNGLSVKGRQGVFVQKLGAERVSCVAATTYGKGKIFAGRSQPDPLLPRPSALLKP
jgi:hypothetical protein